VIIFQLLVSEENNVHV